MKGGLGNMPLTLFIIVAGIVLYFYIRRANLGIDTHPAEGRPVPVGPRSGGPPVLPPIGPNFLPSPGPGKLEQPTGVRLTPTVLY